MIPEAANYLNRIDDLRLQVQKLIDGLPVEALNWRPIEGEEDHATNSLAVMASHIAGAELFWMGEVIGRQPAARDRDAEFKVNASNSEILIDLLQKNANLTRQVLSELTEEELSQPRHVRERTVPVRWAILHVIDHTALHLGHMQITYQLWQGGRSAGAPRWYERIDQD